MAQESIFQARETSDTKSDIKPTKRPRMSLDMFGEGYLSCQESKSATQKREVTIVWLVTNAHVTQGVPRSERVHSLTRPLTKGFFHFTMCRGELQVLWLGLDIGIKLKLMRKTGQYLNKIIYMYQCVMLRVMWQCLCPYALSKMQNQNNK